MPDHLSRQQRSALMSRVKSRGNITTELRMATALRTARVCGWRRHVTVACSDQEGRAVKVRPDFVFRAARVAVFVDGCFWHGCPIHSTAPRTHGAFWRKKLRRNVSRDLLVTSVLRRSGWTVFRIWEHEMRTHLDVYVKRIAAVVRRGPPGAHDRARPPGRTKHRKVSADASVD